MQPILAVAMEPDKLYRTAANPDQVFNLRFISDTGQYAIVSEPGDLDMQSMWGIPVATPVLEVPRSSPDGKCPACGDPVSPADHHTNPNEPATSRWSHRCTRPRCGWLGNLERADAG